MFLKHKKILAISILASLLILFFFVAPMVYTTTTVYPPLAGVPPARHDPRMNAYYQKKLKRHNHNVAITHVATKMLKILWHMLSENMLYNERNERLYNSKLNRMAKSAE